MSVRPFRPRDAADIFLLSSEQEYRAWLPSQVYEDESQARSVLEYLISKYSDPGDPRLGPYVLAIEHRLARTLIGHIGFSPFEKDVEIGFAIGQAYQRRGLATEAVVAGTRWALEAFGLQRVLGIAATENKASCRTLENAGFLRQRDRSMMFQGTEQMVSVYLFER